MGYELDEIYTDIVTNYLKKRFLSKGIFVIPAINSDCTPVVINMTKYSPTLLISGPNGSGKSNLLDVIAIMLNEFYGAKYHIVREPVLIKHPAIYIIDDYSYNTFENFKRIIIKNKHSFLIVASSICLPKDFDNYIQMSDIAKGKVLTKHGDADVALKSVVARHLC